MPEGRVWSRQGVSNAAALTFTGTGNDWQAIDGLDLTVNMLSDEIITDFGASLLGSLVSGTLYCALEVDGQVRPEFIVEFAKLASTAMQLNGSMTVHGGPGDHRVRMMMTASAAMTVNFQARSRYIRIINLAPAG